MMMVVALLHNSLEADYVEVAHIEECLGEVAAGAQHLGVAAVDLQGAELQEDTAAAAEVAPAAEVRVVPAVAAEALVEAAASAGRHFVSADHSEHGLAGPGRQDIAAEGGHLDRMGVAPDYTVLLGLEQWEAGDQLHLVAALVASHPGPVVEDPGPVRTTEAFQRTD